MHEERQKQFEKEKLSSKERQGILSLSNQEKEEIRKNYFNLFEKHNQVLSKLKKIEKEQEISKLKFQQEKQEIYQNESKIKTELESNSKN